MLRAVRRGRAADCAGGGGEGGLESRSFACIAGAMRPRSACGVSTRCRCPCRQEPAVDPVEDCNCNCGRLPAAGCRAPEAGARCRTVAPRLRAVAGCGSCLVRRYAAASPQPSLRVGGAGTAQGTGAQSAACVVGRPTRSPRYGCAQGCGSGTSRLLRSMAYQRPPSIGVCPSPSGVPRRQPSQTRATPFSNGQAKSWTGGITSRSCRS